MNASWAAFPLLVLLAVPCAFLIAVALAPGRNGQIGLGAEGRLAPWQATFLISGLILFLVALLQLVIVLGSDQVGSGAAFWTFAVTGVAAAVIAVRFEFPAATLLATFALGVAVLELVDKVDSGASLAVRRDVILVLGLAYLLLARAIRGSRLAHSHVLVSAAAFALALGAVLGLIGNFSLTDIFALSTVSTTSVPDADSGSNNGWELLLLVVSIGALAYSAWQGYRGAGLVGLLGLLAFISFAASGNLFGWPLILGLVAAGAIALAFRSGSVPSGAAGGVSSAR